MPLRLISLSNVISTERSTFICVENSFSVILRHFISQSRKHFFKLMFFFILTKLPWDRNSHSFQRVLNVSSYNVEHFGLIFFKGIIVDWSIQNVEFVKILLPIMKKYLFCYLHIQLKNSALWFWTKIGKVGLIFEIILSEMDKSFSNF